MWNPFAKKTSPIDAEIERVLAIISTIKPGSEEYKFALEDLKSLNETKALKKPWFTVSGDTIVYAIMGVVQMGMVIGHEHIGNIITTKAVGWVNKGKG